MFFLLYIEIYKYSFYDIHVFCPRYYNYNDIIFLNISFLKVNKKFQESQSIRFPFHDRYL
jgi:hypothetical protein